MSRSIKHLIATFVYIISICHHRYCDEYVPDFVLHGTAKLNEEKLAIDLQNSVKVSERKFLMAKGQLG